MRGPVSLQLLVPLDRQAGTPLHAQIEEGVREAIRSGRLAPGAELPSSRALAGQLGVSRGVVVEAYAQLGAEGYLASSPRSGTSVAEAGARAGTRDDGATPAPATEPRFDFHPGLPDVSAFPRGAWTRSMRAALAAAPHRALAYGDARGAPEVRRALAAYLGRVRGVAADPERVLVCSGQVQGLALLCRALRARGVTRIAMEDPGFFVHRAVAAHNGVEPVAVPVDEGGMLVDRLPRTGAGAVLVTPAHQSPTGAVLAPERRRALLEWGEQEGAYVIEDDYDAEFRYDREPVGAMQGLRPERVAYTGSTSKMLAPALRLAWCVLPRELVGAMIGEKALDDMGTPVLEQLALADFLERGELDRHLRRMRPRYRARREALAVALERHLPGARLAGVTAGLYAVALLPREVDEIALVDAALGRGLAVHGLAAARFDPGNGPPGLVLGYGSQPEGAIERGIAELGRLVREQLA